MAIAVPGLNWTRQRLTTNSATSTTAICRFGSSDPQPNGWELAIAITPAADSNLEGTIQFDCPWLGVANLTFDGFQVGAGGRIHVPSESLTFTFEDVDSGGESIIEIIGRPAIPGIQLGTHDLFKVQRGAPAAGATSTFVAPEGTGWFRVLPGTVDFGATVTVAVQGSGTTWTVWKQDFDKDPTTLTDVGVGGWHILPPLPTRKVLVTNNHATTARNVAVQWKYDLTSVF